MPKTGESKDDNCRCKKCKNIELLLLGVKYSLKRNDHDDLALKTKTEPEEIIQENVCSMKNYYCCNDSCEHHSNTNNIRDALDVLEDANEMRYARWVWRDNRYYKNKVVDTRKDVTELLNDVLIKSFKIHVYNIHCQCSELK